MPSPAPCPPSSPMRSSLDSQPFPRSSPSFPFPDQLQLTHPSLAFPLYCYYVYSLVYPLDTLKTQIQASSSSEKDPNDPTAPPPSPTLISLLLPLFKNPRLIFSLYKGFLASMLNTFSVSTIPTQTGRERPCRWKMGRSFNPLVVRRRIGNSRAETSSFLS